MLNISIKIPDNITKCNEKIKINLFYFVSAIRWRCFNNYI
jgi:hypothetical protein